MLQTLNEKTGKWLVGIIVGAVGISLVGLGFSQYIREGSNHNIVAKIDGYNITQRDFQANYERMKKVVESQLGRGMVADQEAQKILKEKTLQQMTQRIVMQKAAYNLGFNVSQKQVMEAVKEIPAFQVNGKFSPDKLKTYIEVNPRNKSQLLGELNEQLLVGQPSVGIQESAFVLPDELNRWISVLYQKRDFDYVVLSSNKFKHDVKISNKDLITFYENHKADFMSPEKVKVSYIKLSANDIKQSMKISDKEIVDYYKQNKPSFTKGGALIPLRKVKKQIYNRLISQKVQKAFSEKAEILEDMAFSNPTSLKPLAKALNIKIQKTDWISRNGGSSSGLAKYKEVVKAAFLPDTLEQGNNSRALQLDDSTLVVLRVNDHVPAKAKPFAQVEKSVRSLMVAKKSAEKAKQFAYKIVEEAKHGKSVDSLLRSHGFKWQAEKNVGRDNTVVLSPVTQAAFSIKEGSKYPVVITTFDNVALVRLDKITQGDSANLSREDKKGIKMSLRANYGMSAFRAFYDSQINQMDVKIYTDN